MANKDDEFDFEWDDDSSFDSELDKFDSDVDEYHPDELKDAKKDRNPVISKLKSIGPSIHDAGSAVLAGAGVGIAKTIERDMPEVHGVYTGATRAISEAQMLRNEVTDKVKPWWNDTKRVIRKLSQQLNGELPFGLDKKILKLIGEEDRDQEYKQPSKEDLRREQMNSNINSIFELQMQKSMEQQKDAILNRTLDRRVANIHHKESAGFLSKIAENAVFQHAFTSSVFTAYLKKDLELKYKHFYVAEDTLEVFKNHARAVDNKLDAVIKNTALPEADKIYMSERVTGDLKKRLSEGFNEKLSNYFGKIRKNIVDKVKDAVDIGEMLTTALSTQSEMLEYMNDDDSAMSEMMSMNSEPSIFTKKGLMHALLGRLGGFFGKRILRKFTKNLPQETLETIQHYLRGGSNGIALLIDDIKQGRIEGVPDEIRDLIYDFAPDLGRNNDPVIVNEGWHTLDKGGKITNKFIKTVEDVIPNYLAMQTRYLEIMATNTDSGIQKWNFKTLRMETEKERTEEMYKRITHTSDQGKARLQHGIIETSKLIEHTTSHYGALGETYKANLKKALRANAKDIEVFKINLAHSEKYYQVNGNEIVKELESIYKAKNVEELKKIDLFNVGFQDIKAVKAVAGFWLDVLADRTSGSLRPNGAAVDHFNAQLLNEKAKASQLYRQVMEEAYKTGNYDVARKVLGATTTAAGDLKINARDLYVRELDTKATSGEIFSYNEKEVVKQFNEAFRNIKEDELHKNYFVEKFKGIIEKVKKINPTDFAEDMLESPFKSAYLKIYGKDKEKEADKAWKKFLSSIAKTTEFVKNEYDKATEAIDKALDKLKCRSLEEFFDALAEVINTDNSKAWNRLRDSVIAREDNGKTVRNLADLAPEEWYDFFGLLEDPASVAKLFDSGSSTATILKSLFPKDIQLLIYSINNDSTLVEKMKAINKQHNDNDAASVNLRQSKLKKLITESIDRTKQQIGERETSKIWKKSHFNVNRFNAADQARFKGLVNRRNIIDRDIQQVKHDISVGKSVHKNAEELQRDKEAIEEEILKMKRSQDPDFYGYDEEIKKSIAEKEKQRTSVSNDNFNGSSSINIGKQQLDILKSIDEQLGHFYHAFIDINFRNAELARMTDGKVTGDQGRYEIINKMQRWVDILNDPNQAAQHELAQLQLEQNGFSSVEAYQSWLDGGRNDKLNDIKGQVAYDALVNSNKIGTSTGVIYSSTAELDAKIDKMVKDLTENKGSKDNPEELRKQLRFDIIRGERRKHYIQLLKTLYKNDKNPFYNDLAQYIVQNENAFLDNVNATMPDEALYRWIIDSILSTDDDTRASTIKYLRILVVRSSSLTTFVERDDIKIGIIQEFLPRQAGHIFSMALDYIRETEASGTKSDSTIQTNARNLVGLAIGGSSYETVHQAQHDLEFTRDQLDRQIYEIRHSNTGDEGDAVNFTADDVHKLEDAILQRNIVQDNLNTVNERVRNFENDRINSTYNHRNINADDHNSYINRILAGNGGIDYAEAINFIEGVGRSKLRRQNAGNELATNALGEKVTSNKELISNREYNNMQEIINSVDAIRTNYSTKEDIQNNDIVALRRMLTAIYQNINVTDETPDNRELWRIYHAITGNTSLRRRRPQQRFAKGANFDYDGLLNQVDDSLKTVDARYQRGDIKRKRDLDYEKRKIIQNAFAGIDLTDINELNDAVLLGSPESKEVGHVLNVATTILRAKKLMKWAPILDVTWYFKKYYEIPDGIKIIDPHISDMEIKYSVEHPNAVMLPLEIQKRTGIKSHFSYNTNGELEFHPVLLDSQPDTTEDLKLIQSTKFDYEKENYWGILEKLRDCTGACIYIDPTDSNSGLIVIVPNRPLDYQIVAVGHELGHSLDKYGDALNIDGNTAHKGRGHYIEKRADIYGLNKYLSGVINEPNRDQAINRVTTRWDIFDTSYKGGDNSRDNHWRTDLMRRYIRMGKHKGNPLYAGFKDEDLQSQFRGRYAKGDNISFSLPIDQIGGYVDQPTEILGGSGIAGEAGGETIIPHKYNERFKELIYRCLRDTVGENMARKVLRMMKPNDTTKEKLGVNLPDTGYGMMFAKGGDLSGKRSRDEIKKRIESIDATLADHEENSNYRLDYIEKIRKEKADLENQLKVEDISKQKEEYTRQHPTDTIKGILLNIMESNEAIYRKIGDGLLVVDLAAMLDKLKDTKILDKLKSLKIGEKIKNFVFGAYDKGKGIASRVYDFGKNVTKTVASNIGSFGRHMFTNKVCDVYLKSKIEGQVHGDLKIKSSELEHGTIFADPECTKPIYSVADIHPPVYRKVNKDGTETVEEAIREDEGKDGLVDVEGHSLVRFGGKIGRFLHHVAATPLKAILTHKNWERLKGLGTSIASGIGSGINGLFDAYCDVYTTKNLEKPLVYGESIKEGRLVRVLEGGKTKVVPTVFDIDGPCWLLIDDPDKPGERKLGNEVIKEEHITDGLCHKDGSPIESTKIAKAASMLRRAAGAIGNGLLSLTGGIFNAGSTVISWAWDKGKTAAKWVKDRVKDAFTAKNPYIDVCVIRDNEKKVVMHADELRTNKATHRYCFMDKDGKMTPVLSAYGIDAPVFDMRGSKIKDTDAYDHKPVEIITKDDVDNQAIYDTEGNRLTKWAGRSLAGKIGAAALGSVKFGWKAIKGLGKGLWNVGKTVLGGIGSLLGEGGAAVTSFFTKAWSSTLDFFKNSVISRKDLKELVGDRLLDIYGLLYKYMPRQKYNPNDKDGDGDVDGSWADYEQRRKDREAKREQDRLNQWYKDHPNAARGDDESFMSKLKNAFLSGFGGGGGSSTGILDFILGASGLKTLFSGGAGAAAGAGAAGAGKAGLLKRLFSPITNLFARPTVKDGKTTQGKLYNLRKKVAEFFVGNNETLESGKFKRGILNVLRGYGIKAKNAAKGKASGAWSGIKDFFGRLSAERKIAALRSRIAAQHAQIMGRSAAGAATGAAGKGFLSKLFGGKLLSSLGTKFGARIAAAGAANAAPPVIGQIVSAGLLLWTAYDVVKHFATDSTKVKGLRPIRFKAYGVDVKYWEAIEDLETDTFSEFKSGNGEGVDTDRLKKFGYKIDFLDAGEMAYGGDKLEYIRTWYKLKFVPFYQKYVQSLILACKLDPKEQPKGDDIPDQLYPTIVLELTQGFKKVNVGPLKDLNLNKASYEKWLARKREKEREEGLSAGKYSNKDLAERSASSFVTEKFGNVSDHLAYAWNELKHGNLFNAGTAFVKSYYLGIAKIGAAAVDLVWNLSSVGVLYGLTTAFTGETSKNEKAWDEIRMKLYGLDKTTTNAKEYERIVSLIKDFEVRQLHVIDGEEQMVEDDLRELAEEIFTEKVRSKIKFRLNSSGIPIIDTSKDLGSESRSFVISWYKRIFLPIFGLYANMVRMSYGDGPGDNIVIDNVPEDQRAELLKEYEREAKKMLDKNIDTEILRLSPEGFYDYLIMRSEEDIAELSKDSEGMVREDDLSYGDKLSRSLDDAGSDLSKAWSLKFKNPGKALGLAAKGIGKAAWGVVKTTVTSITSSIVDLLVGSANEHRWETRFIDYGFTSREGSSDYFKNDNLRSMEEFENEAGKQLLEDNTGKPDEEYFVKIALNSGFIENCCQKIFNSGSGIDGLSLAATNMGNIFSLWNPTTWGLAAAERVMNRSFGIRSLSELKEKLVDYLVSNAKDNADLEKTELSIKTKVADMINYLDFWWTIRFKPVFDAFISVVAAYGVEPDDIDVDDIPQESRDEAFEAYKKASAIALKKDRAAMYTLSAEGCALYLEKVEEYREDAKDGTIDNSGNPLAKFYKEKEKQFEDNVVAAVVANAPALDNVEKARVAKALSKASVEIDSELNDVNTMAKYAAKDILDQLGVKDLLNKNHTPKESIYGVLMKLTMGENHYDKIAKGSGWIFDDGLGKLFTKFVENAHECLYGTDADKLADYLKEFAESCLQSDLFIFNTPKGGKVKFENIPQLNAWIDAAYPNLGGGDHTAIYFGNWFAYRFMPYYAYFVTLVNKANDKQDLKEKPDVDDLTVMRRNYVIDKLVKSENKGLISGKAKAMKIDANSFYKFFEKLNETEGNDKVRRAELRSNGRKFLEEQMKDVERQLAEDRAKRKASNKSKEDIKRDVEEKDLANVDAVSTVKPGTRVGDNKAKRKGRSCTDAERQYIYNFLTSELGLTPEQAAAVMGNMMQESSMSPDVINSIGATGLFQWLGYRVNGGRGYKGLIPFAKENGLDPYSVEAQMKYLKWELENVPYEKNRFDKYVRSIVTDPKNPNKTVAQCAVGFRVGFERCGEHEAQDSKRVGYAKEFYRKFGPDQIPSYIPDTTTLDTAPNDSTGTTGAMTNTQLTGSVNNTATGLPQHIVRYEPLKDDEQELTDMANSVVTEDTTDMGDKLREVADVKSGVNIKTMHPVLKDRFAAMSKAFTEIVGHRPLITSGARTMAQQAALKKKYGKGAASPNPYAPHISGLALDASSQDMNKAEELGLLKKFGLHRPLKDWGTKKEPWHVEIAESRSFGGGIINQKSIDYANSLIKKGNTSPNGAIAPSGIVAPTKDDVTENSETAVAQQNKDVINSAKTTKRNKAMPAPSGDAKRTKATSLTAKVRNKINQSMNDATAQASANIRASQRTVEQPTPASVISNTSTEGNNDNIRTLSAMQTDITNANSGNAPVISELKVISSILAAFKGDVSGFIKLITTNAGLTKTNTANKSTAEIATDKNISDEKLNILIDKLNELAQLISTSGNPSTAKVPQKYHVRDNYMQGYPLQANKVNS